MIDREVGVFPVRPPLKKLGVQRRPRRDRVVAMVNGIALTEPSISGLMKRVTVKSPEEVVRVMAATARELRRRAPRIFSGFSGMTEAFAGTTPKDVVLIIRFGAMGDMIQLRAAAAQALEGLSDRPRIWLKTRKQYVDILRGRGVFDKVVWKWPAWDRLSRVVNLDSWVERDHAGDEAFHRHRTEMFWDWFNG